MRIIAGELGGRRFEAPEGDATRPLLERVREAMFGTLSTRIEDVDVLDLYAGSGSQGLEALSRGARRARFVEKDLRTLAIVQRNVRELGLAERARVVRGNALDKKSWLDPDEPDARYAIAFVDPPFEVYDDPDARSKLVTALAVLAREALSENGVIALHAPARASEMLRFASDLSTDVRRYGSSSIVYVERVPPRAAENP